MNGTPDSAQRRAQPGVAAVSTGSAKPPPAPEPCFVCGETKTPIGFQSFTGRAFCSSKCWETYKRREGL